MDYLALVTYWSQLFWPMARIGGLMLTMPVFATALVPPRIKIVFIVALALVVAPYIPKELSFLHFKALYLVYLLQEVLFGILMGFILQIVFQSFVIAGQIIAMQSGLGFAVMVDPASRASVPLVSQLYLILITLVFLALNGHIVLLGALLESFISLPPGHNLMDLNTLGQVFGFSGWMIKEAVIIALPAILSLLIVNLSFGIMARVAPQLNIFSLGFPITLLMGILILYFSIPSIVGQTKDALNYGMQIVKGMLH
jgi:flagellar biosynthetic protein FliR